jgi:hypothetical protein
MRRLAFQGQKEAQREHTYSCRAQDYCAFYGFQSSSASRFTAGAAGFLNFSQSGDLPER